MAADLETLGRELRERRRALGIPRAELARRAGVSPTYIWLVEEAKPRAGGEPSRPGEQLLQRWTRALGMDERYTRQALRLAGYEPPAAEQGRRPAVRRPLEGMTPAAAPRIQADVPPPIEEDLMFAAAPYTFHAPREMEQGALVEQLGEVLGLADEVGSWEETVRLLRSLLDWLAFRLEREE